MLEKHVREKRSLAKLFSLYKLKLSYSAGSKRLRPKDSDEAAYGGKNFKKSAKVTSRGCRTVQDPTVHIAADELTWTQTATMTIAAMMQSSTPLERVSSLLLEMGQFLDRVRVA